MRGDLIRPGSWLCAVTLLSAALFANPPARTDAKQGSTTESDTPIERVSVGEARRQAELLHKTHLALLREVHRRYYEEDAGQIIPARTLEDIFKEVDEGTSRETRWIAVNSEAMNVDHKPRPGFETNAVARLSEGEEFYETVKEGVYYRAGIVPLKGGCLSCHVSALSKSVENQRVAGLVVSMPVEE